ncbi:MAG: carbon monoxide dehydrogenase subunit G [Acidobacteriota bacterium]
MKLEGTYVVHSPREHLWRLMIDPDVLRRVVPGCEALEALPDGAYKLTLKAGVGSIKGLFNGTIKLEDLCEPEHYKMNVDARGTSGFVKGIGTLDLAEQGEDTLVTYAGDINIGGTLASVGQRMVQSSAKMMTAQFFTAIEAEAAAAAVARQTASAVVPPKQSFFATPCDGSQGESDAT